VLTVVNLLVTSILSKELRWIGSQAPFYLRVFRVQSDGPVAAATSNTMAQPQTRTTDFAPGTQQTSSVDPPSTKNQTAQNHSQHTSSAVGGIEMIRVNSSMSQSQTLTLSRGGTLKKRQSLSRKTSLKRIGSKKGSRPGIVKDHTFSDDVAGHGSEMNSAFFTPVPTAGIPTEILAGRFQGKFRPFKCRVASE